MWQQKKEKGPKLAKEFQNMDDNVTNNEEKIKKINEQVQTFLKQKNNWILVYRYVSVIKQGISY